ncbi:MAG: heme exporter protein CcmB [Bacteroidia bacterium]|jgi:heme exporter protein B|nr:heme exporter protein CcmB [Bacteroidia bacterium]
MKAHPFWILLKKDIQIEWRTRYAFNGIVLQSISSVFIAYAAAKMLNPAAWNALFWIILLFSGSTAAAKGFIGDTKGRQLYYYSISPPEWIILSKVAFNTLFIWIISAITTVVYAMLLGNMASSFSYFASIIALAGIGISGCFTFISSIASKSGNGSLLMPVLGFPVVIPLLLMIVKASKKAVDGLDPSLILPDALAIFAFGFIVICLSYVLFPYLWKD